MFSLLRKEVSGFFSSLIGYISIAVFLLVNSLFLLVFPGDLNVIDSGYADLEPLFFLAPWVFLFLVPAITMRSFAEEKRTGTIELLFTRPLTDLSIVLAKYFAGLVLVLFSLLPTLLYYLSVYLLGDPVGCIDTGGTWGSYLGLFFLAAIYVAVGIFASSLTDNQIVAFILAVLLSFLLYLGFDFIGQLEALKSIDRAVMGLGVNEHYRSISRGVVDSRDLLYFVGVVAIFILLTKSVLESRKW